MMTALCKGKRSCTRALYAARLSNPLNDRGLQLDRSILSRHLLPDGCRVVAGTVSCPVLTSLCPAMGGERLLDRELARRDSPRQRLVDRPVGLAHLA